MKLMARTIEKIEGAIHMLQQRRSKRKTHDLMALDMAGLDLYGYD